MPAGPLSLKTDGGNGGDEGGEGGGGGGGSGGSSGSGLDGGVGGVSNVNAGGLGGVGSLGNGSSGGKSNEVGVDNSSCPACGGGGGGGTNSGAGGSGSMGIVYITIPAPLYTTVSSNQTVCSGGTIANLTSTESGENGAPYTYQWQKSTTDATTNAGFFNVGAGLDNYTPSPETVTSWYRMILLKGTNPACVPDTSDAIEVAIAVLGGSTSFSQTICDGGVISPLTALPYPSNMPATYEWESSTDGISFTPVLGEINNTYAPAAALTSTMWYRSIISAPGCVTYTTSIVDAVPSLAAVTVEPGKLTSTIYSTNTYTFVNAAVGGSATTGIWEVTNGGGGNHIILPGTETHEPDQVTFTPELGFTGTVTLSLTTSDKGCGGSIVASKKIIVLESYELDSVWTSPGNHQWTVPKCIKTVTVQVWGAGGSGGGADGPGATDGGGGGGGAFSSSVIQVNEGDVYDLFVGAGGTGSFTTKGEGGEDSWFGSAYSIMASGGAGGLRNNLPGEDGSGGLGGQAETCFGTIRYSGGMGGTGGGWPGGGGGSSAGYTAAGIDGRGTNNGWPNGSSQTTTPGGGLNQETQVLQEEVLGEMVHNQFPI